MPRTPLDVYSDLSFPGRGVDTSGSFGKQRPGTTPEGENVRTFDTFEDRSRGGSRPGLVRYADDQTPGDSEVQELNVVAITDVEHLLYNQPIPDDIPTIEDPSSPGQPFTWTPGIIVLDPLTGQPVINPDTGLPYTSINDRTRNPGGPGGQQTVFPRRVPERGSAWPPNPNIPVYEARVGTGPGFCYQGQITVEIHAPAPDLGNWDGQTPAFVGVLCAGSPGPTTGAVTRLAADLPLAGGGFIAAGTNLLAAAGQFLAVNVGEGATATVILDLISVAGSACTGHSCSGAPTPSITGGSVGAVISAS